ncbi:hypothetical protein ILYODFUR_008702 [Ilyodon furcidens]|uniref:Uncharacterized protein n=1 Tax=Ilyodon furcidens TaxID=33524 RepID=A0ABV0V3J3_9TELE
MDELKGDRPLSNPSGNGVDIGLEEERTNGSDDHNSKANEEDSSLTDDESTFNEEAGSSTQQIPNVTEDSCPRTFEETWTSKKSNLCVTGP